jgi:uncharacterized UPF0146 family protein
MTEQYRKQIVGGVDYVYGAEWTKSLEKQSHWVYYWYQQKLMEGLVVPGEDKVLELGVGSGFAANYGRSRGVDITTLDIDEEKKPDIVANVVTYDFDCRYDHLMAFEILEHIPYTEFEKIIRRIPTFIGKYAFISLPRNEEVAFKIDLAIPRLPPIKYEWRRLKNRITTKAHHWEMDYGEHTTESVKALFTECGLRIARTLVCDYIRFYALEVVGDESGSA